MLAASAGLAYGARTQRRLNAKLFCGCYLMFSGVASAVIYRQSHHASIDMGQLDLTLEWVVAAGEIFVGICLIIFSGIQDRKKQD